MDIKSIGVKKIGFTLAELMVSVFISMYIFLCAWAMYMMGWAWWHEILPQTECQRMARIAISAVTKGMIDSTAGTDTINFITYGRRNGIEHACRTRADTLGDSPFATPTITDNGHRINFKLEPDPAFYNARSFYLGQDNSGQNVIYYKYSDYESEMIRATRGITDLTFEMLPGYENTIIKVTATMQKVVKGSRKVPYEISVVYTDYVYLRNV